jgi:hypothetical protein
VHSAAPTITATSDPPTIPAIAASLREVLESVVVVPESGVCVEVVLESGVCVEVVVVPESGVFSLFGSFEVDVVLVLGELQAKFS